MNDNSHILDDRSALMLYLADELPIGMRHELDSRLVNEPELAFMLEELRELDRDAHRLMELPMENLQAEAVVRRTMAGIRKQALAPAPVVVAPEEATPAERHRRRATALGYSAFAAAACVVLAMGLWTLGVFDRQTEIIDETPYPPTAVVDLDEGFLAPSDALTPRLNEASEHLRALQENQPDDEWLMMM